MEPLPISNKRASPSNTYAPHRPRWPGVIGAAAIVAAVLGVTMWAQHDDARKIGAPSDRRADVTAPAQAGSDETAGSRADPDSASGSNTDAARNDESKVAARQPAARR